MEIYQNSWTGQIRHLGIRIHHLGIENINKTRFFSAISKKRSTIDLIQGSTILDRESTILEKRSAILEQESAILEQESAILDQETDILDLSPNMKMYEQGRVKILLKLNQNLQLSDIHLIIKIHVMI